MVIRIRDYGPGIPDDELPLVKRSFSRGSSKARGSGIGLAVCDEIIEMHGGSLDLSMRQVEEPWVVVQLPVAGNSLRKAVPWQRQNN